MRTNLRLIHGSHPTASKRSPEALWEAFVAAQERSKRTLVLADGIAAGKAYAAFLEAFAGPGAPGTTEKGAANEPPLDAPLCRQLHRRHATPHHPGAWRVHAPPHALLDARRAAERRKTVVTCGEAGPQIVAQGPPGSGVVLHPGLASQARRRRTRKGR